MNLATHSPYLMAWQLWGKKVVVVGGGRLGEGKIEALKHSGAHLVVFDPTPSARVHDIAKDGCISLRTREVRRRDFRGAAMVIAATGHAPTNSWIAKWATRFGAVVNAMDGSVLRPQLGPAPTSQEPEQRPRRSARQTTADTSKSPWASSFAVIDGRQANIVGCDWRPLASEQLNLVVLTSATTATEIASQLLSNGRRAETLVGFVHRAGLPGEDTEITSLVDVSLSGCPFKAPTVMIVGDVSDLSSTAGSAVRDQGPLNNTDCPDSTTQPSLATS